MKYIRRFFLIVCLINAGSVAVAGDQPLPLFAANHPYIRYVGRVDFSYPQAPRFWSPGVYIEIRFTGTSCILLLNDEELYGKYHNYIEITVDNNKSLRVKTTGKSNTIPVNNLKEGTHTILICRNTESAIGYLEFTGIKCKKLLPLPPASRKIEFIGNSITCGTGIDVTEFPCNMGYWYDQHNAWMSYGPLTARSVHAQWMLTSVSGIGLMHSCCGLPIVMPRVYDKVQLITDSIPWDFKKYQPDVVTICLGQNDGVQDSTVFCNNYLRFIRQVRSHNPNASIVCLSSPMADPTVAPVLKKYIAAIAAAAIKQGDKKLSYFFFNKWFHHGCGGHPDMTEQGEIAKELTGYIKKLMNW